MILTNFIQLTMFFSRTNIADIKQTMWTHLLVWFQSIFIAIYVSCMFTDSCILYISIFVLLSGVIKMLVTRLAPRGGTKQEAQLMLTNPREAFTAGMVSY